MGCEPVSAIFGFVRVIQSEPIAHDRAKALHDNCITLSNFHVHRPHGNLSLLGALCHSRAAVGEPQTNERRKRADAHDVAPLSEVYKKATDAAPTPEHGGEVAVRPESVARPGLILGPGLVAPRTREGVLESAAGSPSEGTAPKAEALEKLHFSEEDLRIYIGSFPQMASGVLASVRCSPSARLEPATDVAELFWKLVERRLYGAVFCYEKAGQRWVDEIAGVPGGFSVTRRAR